MASDPLADAYNLMGAQGMTAPNPYLQYTGKIPMAGYRGAPTDAMGNPIQSFQAAQAAHDAWTPPARAPASAPGTTLNSAPQGYASSMPILQGMPAASNAAANSNPMMAQLAGWQALGNPQMASRGDMFGDPYLNQISGPGGQQAAPAPAPTNPIDMRQAYLDALANPGKVTTPGAQMLPGTKPTGPQSQPSVLANFLAQHPSGGTTGAGGYSNQGFFNTLNALKAGTA